MKKHMFLLPFARLFTRSEGDAYDAIPFRTAESFGDETAPALTSPSLWSEQAVEVMAEAACPSFPASLHAVEENTVPSWLWRHHGKGTSRQAETDLRSIFDRVVGSATATGWHKGLFSSEKHARSCYDEARFALMQRHIAFEPGVIKNWGVTWAYGIKAEPHILAKIKTPHVSVNNAALDAEHATTPPPRRAAWKKALTVSSRQSTRVNIKLADIAADWHSETGYPARAALDVLALRHNDGSVNIDALRHCARLATLLIDLHDAKDVTLGIANLSALLMALGLGYDSEAGRALVASVVAIVTAECLATSAELAALRGASPAFTDNRDAIMRRLRNHRRAAHGDRTDYEHVSIVPKALALKNCPDLALAAAAQQRWDDAVTMAQLFGLRATHVTDLTPSSILAMVMQSASLGLQPMHSLTVINSDDQGIYHTTLHPAVGEALSRLSYPHHTASIITQHIAGTGCLRKTPVINIKSLRACGLSEASCAKIEAYLPQVNTLQLAITPWVIGLDACRTELKIAPRLLASQRFDLLKHLGFSAEDIAEANAVCYGYGTVRNAKALHLRHRPVFAHGGEINNDALIRMAAAVQSFVTGETGTVVTLPVRNSMIRGTEMTLAAWRQGLKAVTILFDPAVAEPVARTANTSARLIKAASHAHGKPMRPTSSVTGRTTYGKKEAPISAMRKASERRSKNT